MKPHDSAAFSCQTMWLDNFLLSRTCDLTANLSPALQSLNLVLFSPFLTPARTEDGEKMNNTGTPQGRKPLSDADPPAPAVPRSPPSSTSTPSHRPQLSPVHLAIFPGPSEKKPQEYCRGIPSLVFAVAPSTILCRLHQLPLVLDGASPTGSCSVHGHGGGGVVGGGGGGHPGVHGDDPCGVLHDRGGGRRAVRRGFRPPRAAGAGVREEARGGGRAGGNGVRAAAATGAARGGDGGGAESLQWVRPQETAAHGHQGPNLRRHAEQVRAFFAVAHLARFQFCF